MIINAGALAHIYVQEGRLCRRGGADVQWGHRYILCERSDKGGAYTRVLWYNTEYKKQSLVYIMIGNNFNFIDSPRRKSFIPFSSRPPQDDKTSRPYNIIIYFITIGVFSAAHFHYKIYIPIIPSFT